jgi:DNA-binding phage protein
MSPSERVEGAFWQDLRQDLEDDDFRRHYVLTSRRIAAIDCLVHQLDAHREACGLSKAELARAVGKTPEAVRRLLTANNPNPTLGTFVDLAAAVGLKVTVEPMTEEERRTNCAGLCSPGRLAPN